MIDSFFHAQRYIINHRTAYNVLISIQTCIIFKYYQNTVVQIYAVYFYIVNRFYGLVFYKIQLSISSYMFSTEHDSNVRKIYTNDMAIKALKPLKTKMPTGHSLNL